MPKGDIIHIEPVEHSTELSLFVNLIPTVLHTLAGLVCFLVLLIEALDISVNQLVDAGALNNMSGGFVGKNLRIKMGQMQTQTRVNGLPLMQQVRI